jgi:hypothetical protein
VPTNNGAARTVNTTVVVETETEDAREDIEPTQGIAQEEEIYTNVEEADFPLPAAAANNNNTPSSARGGDSIGLIGDNTKAVEDQHLVTPMLMRNLDRYVTELQDLHADLDAHGSRVSGQPP